LTSLGPFNSFGRLAMIDSGGFGASQVRLCHEQGVIRDSKGSYGALEAYEGVGSALVGSGVDGAVSPVGFRGGLGYRFLGVWGG
jgi:hypothetical protein